MARFELEQDGIVVATVDGPRDSSLLEIIHYGVVYGQDRPCVANEVRGRKRIKVATFPSTPSPGAAGGGR